MTTFWTGAALAADYGNILQPSLAASLALHQACRALDLAISRAVQAQLDEPPLVCWLDDAADDEVCLMHSGGSESWHPAVWHLWQQSPVQLPGC